MYNYLHLRGLCHARSIVTKSSAYHFATQQLILPQFHSHHTPYGSPKQICFAELLFFFLADEHHMLRISCSVLLILLLYTKRQIVPLRSQPANLNRYTFKKGGAIKSTQIARLWKIIQVQRFHLYVSTVFETEICYHLVFILFVFFSFYI